MPRSSAYYNFRPSGREQFSKKGQWFLVSAIIITSSLLSISVVFKNYFLTDASKIAKMNDDYLLMNVETQLTKIIDSTGYDQPGCTNLKSALDSFIDFSDEELSGRGRLVTISYIVDCAGRKTSIYMSMSSDEMSISKTLVI